jgi:hypothetical protein
MTASFSRTAIPDATNSATMEAAINAVGTAIHASPHAPASVASRMR